MQKNLLQKLTILNIILMFAGTSFIPILSDSIQAHNTTPDIESNRNLNDEFDVFLEKKPVDFSINKDDYQNLQEDSALDILNNNKFDTPVATFPSSFAYKERNVVDTPFNNSNNEKTAENVTYLEEEFSSLLEKKIEVKNSDVDRKIGEFLNDNRSLHSFQNDEMSNTEYDFVEVTRWADPTRERPLYYCELTQPIRVFENELIYSLDLRDNLVYLIIDEVLYNQGLDDEISVFISDLENDGYNVELYIGTYGNPEDLKSFLQSAYPNLTGAIFVGNIATAWYEHVNDFYGPAEFPMDLFYMDLDGTWTDTDENGLYDNHTGNVELEIWIGRLDATTLNGDTVGFYENYFIKNHEYRVGNLKLPNRALVYVDDDWAYEHQHWEDDHRFLYDYTTYVGHKDGTNAVDYKNRLKWDYDWITIFAHSSSNGHSLRSNYVSESWISSEDIKNIDPHGLFYNLFACSSARFTEEDYIAGRYLFADMYGLAVVGSTKTGAMLSFDKFYQPLGEGKNLGEAFKDWFNYIAIDGFRDTEISWHYGMELFADPTLKPNVPNDLPVAQIDLRDYIEVNLSIEVLGTARRGLKNSSTFENFTISFGVGINPEEWITRGITIQENGAIEIENDNLGEFDTSFTGERFNTLKLTVSDEVQQKTNYRLVLDVNNIEFLDPVNNDFRRTGDVISLWGTVVGTNFQHYVIEYGVGEEPIEWFSDGITLANDGSTQIIDGELGIWDTSQITQANYFTLKITRHDIDEFETTDNITIVLDPSYLEGWPQKVDYRLIAQSVGVDDVNNDNFCEIFAGESSYDFYDMSMYGWNYDGGNLDGWPKEWVASNLRSAPALADIDGDSDLEIFVGTGYGKVEAWHHHGSRVDGWPVYDASEEIISAITIGDIDNDGDLEIIAGSLDDCVYAWHHDGSLCSGFPISTDGSITTSPAIGDIDEDGDLEIIVCSNDRNVYAWHHDGTTVSGWPKSDPQSLCSSPALADIDNDGDLEIIVGSDKLYVWHHDGTLASGWPQDISTYSSPALADIDDDGDLEIVVAGWLPNIYSCLTAYHHDGTIVAGWPVSTPGVDDTSPIIGDIDGDFDMEILISSDPGCDKFYAFHHNGEVVSGWPKITPTNSFSGWHCTKYSSPVLADIDSDGDIEVILGDEGFLFVWDLNGSYNPSCIEWGMFQHDNQHTGTYTSPTFYVDDDFNASTPGWQIDHFDNIQDAIDIIPMGGTVFVYNGIYNENIIIGKNLDLIGENENSVIINGDVVGTVVRVYADQVKISGFKIQNGNYGIILDSSDNIISDNNVFNNYYGIRLLSSNNNILNNNISNNNYGIRLSSSNQNTISDNTVSDNIGYGIYIFSSSNNNIIYHNNLLQNNQNAYDQCINNWDNGYTIGGNYWDDYTGTDNNGDGIGDTPYYISGSSNQDNYPLMHSGPPPDVVFIDDDFTSSTPGWGYDHFDTIRYGINRVQENGMVNVSNGAYYESIVVDKTINLIGEDKDNTIIDGGGNWDVICVSANNVNINGFKIRSGDFAGIEIWSNYNIISENIIRSNNQYGIILFSSNNIITNNNVFNNYYGVRLYSSNNNILKNNISNNNYGIRLSSSNQNTISDNTIVDNIDYGIYIYSSSNNNLFYHNNLLYNGQNAYDECANNWDAGYSSGGNYWDDYSGTDDNGDGIGDTPYYIPGGSNQDNYPFMMQNGWLWPASFTGNFGDYGLDINSNGLYDYLIVDAELEVLKAGEYKLSGSLRYYDDASGWWNTIDYDYNYTYLDVGTHTISLQFEGYKIYNIEYNGQFKADLNLYYTATGNWIDDAEYITQSYNYTDFERPPIEFTNVFNDYGLDTDQDELYNYLVIEAEVNVTEPGEYELSGSLRYYDNSSGWWTTIDYDYNYTTLDVGTHTISLQFEGYKIYNTEYNGQFKANLDLYTTDDWNWIDNAEHMTQSYNYIEFQPPPGQFTENYNDYGIDTDGNELYDYLVVEAEVNVLEAGDYRLEIDLHNGENNDHIYQTDGDWEYLEVGTWWLNVSFDGYILYNYGYNGTYVIDDIWLYEINTPNYIDYSDDPYYTNTYNYTDFDGPPIEFTEVFNDYGLDTDEDGLYDYLVIEAEVNVTEPGEYQLSGNLRYYDNSSGWWTTIDYDYNYTTLDIGTHTISLQFDGYKIYNTGYNGTFKADLDLYIKEDLFWYLWMDDAEYITQSYNYTDFERPPIEFTNVFNDYGLDTDQDELYNYLVIEAEVNVTEPGEYELSADLYYFNDDYGFWDYCCYTNNYTQLSEGIQTISLQFDTLWISQEIWSIEYNDTFRVYLNLYQEGAYFDDAEYYTNSYNYTSFPPSDITPPTISNLTIPDYVGIDHSGDISIYVSDDNLQRVEILLSDINELTFNQSLVIWYYLNDSGLNGIYAVRNYSGFYAKLQQGNKSDSITYFIFSNWNSSEKIYSYGYFLKNQTAEMIPVFMEFNLSDGTLYNIAMISSSESGKIELEYIDYMIESGESIIYSISMVEDGPGMILQNNYTLYSIGNTDNPYLSWCPLGNGEYYGMIDAIDKVYNSNETNFNLTVYHGQLPNNPPYEPSNPNPENGSTNISIDTTLNWIGGDPDPGDTITYDVYFGTSIPPPIEIQNHSTNSYNPETLEYNTTYYWKIIAWDNHGNYTEGEIWNFETEMMEEITVMRIIPSSDTVNVGDNFIATIYIDPVEPIGGWQIYEFNFTQGIVNATEITPGAFWETNFDPGDIDNENGTITDVQVWSLGPYPDVNHTACMINFTALQLGICTFEIMRVDITNDNFEDIPVTTHTAMITVVDNMPPFVYDEYPQNESIDVERPPAELNVTVEDPDGDAMDVYIKWKNHDGEWITIENYTGVGNGTYNYLLPNENDWIWGNTTYVWSINVKDGTSWTNETYIYTTGGSRYDVNNNDIVNFQDAGLVWVHRTSEVDYDGIYDVNQDGQVNFQDAGLTWINRD